MFIVQLALAQIPQKFSYQFVLRNTSGGVLVNKTISVRIGIHTGSLNGSEIYAETFSAKSSSEGVVTVNVGSGLVVLGTSLSNIAWEEGPYFLKTKVDVNGGSNFKLMAGREIMAVPYTFHSAVADTSTQAFNNNYNNVKNKPAIDENSTDDVLLTTNQTIGGIKTFTGTVSVPNPVGANDAANKAYIKELEARIQYLENWLKVASVIK